MNKASSGKFCAVQFAGDAFFIIFNVKKNLYLKASCDAWIFLLCSHLALFFFTAHNITMNTFSYMEIKEGSYCAHHSTVYSWKNTEKL